MWIYGASRRRNQPRAMPRLHNLMSGLLNHEIVIAATDLRSGTRCLFGDGDPLTNEVRSLGVGWYGCTVPVGYLHTDRSASGTV